MPISLILGKMVEVKLQNSLKILDGQWWLIFTQPLAALFLFLAVLGLSWPAIAGRLVRRRSGGEAGLNE